MEDHLRGDIEACRSLQKDEWDVLESIYPDCISSENVEGSFKLEVPVEFTDPREVIINPDSTTLPIHPIDDQLASGLEKSIQNLSALPPLLLQLVLPPLYPLHGPPEVKSLRASQSWLQRIPELLKVLNEMWIPGEGCLCIWLEFIYSGDFMDALGLISPDHSIILIHPTPQALATVLKTYDTSSKASKFSQNTFECSICLTAHKGSRCLELSCSHIFCRFCLEEFWKLCILEGDVGRVGCPDPSCVKEGREANEEEVARVVTQEEVTRWKWLRNKRAVEKDPSIIHCPMTFCQLPVSAPPIDAGKESGWDRLRSCNACSYNFCAFCKRTWHGPISNCPISATETVVLEYLALPEGSPERQIIERRFGKVNVARLVAAYEEEKANQTWLQASTMACPGCKIYVQKSLGCNHMTCAKCKQHFCYRCGEKLNPSNPYAHFSTPGHRCYYKLFDFQSVDEEWQPMEGLP